jgi:hypothetical protein
MLAALALLCGTTAARAQGSIAGAVKDTTGAVLPGVTVEASSPALIEKTRTVTTDGEGQYKIIDLRPGTYLITFSLTGFNSVRRENVELVGSAIVIINADLRVGDVAETVTVSGQTPIVDTQSVLSQKVLTRELLDALPSSRTFTSLAAILPGATSMGGSQVGGGDVGGSSGDTYVALSVHGGRSGDQHIYLDGMRTNNTHGGGGGSGYSIYMNPGSVAEVNLDIGNLGAESEAGGIKINIIPKEGGNIFSGWIFGNATGQDLQSNNLTDELRARGLKSVSGVKKIYDFNFSFGGPLVKDKLWFHTAHRWWGNQNYVAGVYFNATPTAFRYTPDLSRPAIEEKYQRSNNLRFTWQISRRNKLTVYYDNQYQCLCFQGVAGAGAGTGTGASTISPEATQRHSYHPDYNIQAKWSAPLTNKLLLEAGSAMVAFGSGVTAQPGVCCSLNSITELSTNFIYRSPVTYAGTTNHSPNFLSHMYNQRFSLAYITGSHAIKSGVLITSGLNRTPIFTNGDMTFQFLNGAPRSLTQWATPIVRDNFLNAEVGIFAQDQWTVRRLTINYGARFNYLNAKAMAKNVPAGTFVPARSYPEIKNLPNWHDTVPRFGAAYDLFGNGKTALKFSIGKYLIAETVTTAIANNPQTRIAQNASRAWTDANTNFVPDCDLFNVAANGECGALSDVNFGKGLITGTSYDPDLLTGSGNRAYNWETTAGVQHELRPGVALSVSYYHRWYGNFWVNTNRLVASPGDFDPYCITAPSDSRLPGGGGNQICGFYDIKPAKFGQVQNFVTAADNFGDIEDTYDGVDVLVNTRFGRGGLLQGGFNAGREIFDTCDVVGKVAMPGIGLPYAFTQNQPFQNTAGVASPSKLYCRVSPPWLSQLKLQGSYPLPWAGVTLSAMIQSIPGPEVTAAYVATNAQIAPSLGRNLAAGAAGTATVQLISPGTMYEGRVNQVDFRVSKIVKFNRARIQANLDLYNLFNANSILAINTRFGPSWRLPFAVMQGRLLKLGGQLDF